MREAGDNRYIKLWLKGMQSNETWFQFMYWQLVEKQNFIQQLIWSYPNHRKLQALEIFYHNRAEICRRIPRTPKSRRFLNIIILECARFEKNHDLNSIIVFSHKWDESLRSHFHLQKYDMVHLILRMFVWATFNSVFDFMSSCSGWSQ